MKVLIAFDSFKGSMTSIEAGMSASFGFMCAFPDAQIKVMELGDGGEGTAEALLAGRESISREIEVQGPLAQKVKAKYYLYESEEKKAVINVSEACGLPLVPEEFRSPMNTTTYGVGQMILDAITLGATELIIGLGGSSTNDGGLGMLEALGAEYEIHARASRYITGADLPYIRGINLDKVRNTLQGIKIKVLCDVDNPLYGTQGAACVFGPQKGASEEEIKILDEGLRNLSKIASIDGNRPGYGAAGGLGFAFGGILNAELKKGADLVLDEIGFDEELNDCDLFITGEGMIDNSSLNGKAVYTAAKRALEKGVRTVVFVGKKELEAERIGVEAIIQITRDFSVDFMNREIASENLRKEVADYFGK